MILSYYIIVNNKLRRIINQNDAKMTISEKEQEAIKSLENELGESIPEISELERYRLGYYVQDNTITGLSLFSCGLSTLPKTLESFSSLKEISSPLINSFIYIGFSSIFPVHSPPTIEVNSTQTFSLLLIFIFTLLPIFNLSFTVPAPFSKNLLTEYIHLHTFYLFQLDSPEF